MFNVGGGELLVILLVALIVLGPQRLPDAAKQVGRVVGDLRRISSGFQQELKDALDTDDAPTPLRRKESAPLAATVAEADTRTTPSTSSGNAAGATTGAAAFGAASRGVDADGATGVDADASGPAGAADADPRDQTTVAPAVAAALDEIVAPIDAPAVPPADDLPTAGAVGSDAERAGRSGGGALGDERAAS